MSTICSIHVPATRFKASPYPKFPDTRPTRGFRQRRRPVRQQQQQRQEQQRGLGPLGEEDSGGRRQGHCGVGHQGIASINEKPNCVLFIANVSRSCVSADQYQSGVFRERCKWPASLPGIQKDDERQSQKEQAGQSVSAYDASHRCLFLLPCKQQSLLRILCLLRFTMSASV